MPPPIPSFSSHNAVALALGIPAAVAGYLRLKYGPTIWADLALLKYGLKLTKEIEKLIADGTTLVDIFEAHVQKTPDKTLILYQNESHSYADVDREANKMARFVLHSGVVSVRGCVAIMMYNEPAFLTTLFAMAKLGLSSALINYNLRAQSLLHCITASEARAVVCGREPDLLNALLEIMPELKSLGITVWVHGRLEEVLPASVTHFDPRDYSDEFLPREIRKGQTMDDVSCYIFTSGTTGLPKPVSVKNWRAVQAMYVTAQLNWGPDDIVYVCLPLYHSAGLAVGFFNILRVGGTAAISHHFSARNFWDDVRRYKATVIQYIGETARYLTAQPPRPDDGKYAHKLKWAIGNGLRPDVWEEFQRRFNIGQIAEFFGATEANHLTMNIDGKVGASGRYTPFYKAMLDIMEFIRCDTDTAEPIRDKNGLCIPVNAGETGLLLFKVTPKKPLVGYKASKEVNDKKLVRNVKKSGDEYFNTGDLMMCDKDGYIYFIDRLGDTYRWKGENVATTEVAEILNKYPGIQETNVYGVKIQGNMDGRAGMAAIVLSHGNSAIDMAKFYEYVTGKLPSYACPKFVRIMPEMHITGTFKHKKTDLVKQGFDPNLVADPLYFLDTEKQTYIPLDMTILQNIVGGRAKL